MASFQVCLRTNHGRKSKVLDHSVVGRLLHLCVGYQGLPLPDKVITQSIEMVSKFSRMVHSGRGRLVRHRFALSMQWRKVKDPLAILCNVA